MKTAEELYEDANKRADVAANSGKTMAQLKQDVIDWIEEWRLDAFKAGERFARDVVMNTSTLKDKQGSTGWREPLTPFEFAQKVSEAILTDANNRTSLPVDK